MTEKVSIHTLHEFLRYDPHTGILTRKKSHKNYPAGRVATIKKRSGYLYVKVRNAQMLAHRVAWALHYGQWPTQEMHHIDNDKTNNAIANLMVCERAFNNAMRPFPRDRDLPRGVHHDPRPKSRKRPYQARLSGKSLGMFSTVSEAEAAYRREFMARFGEEPPQAA